MLKGIHHVAILVSDYQRSKRFYVDVLGFEVIDENYRADRDSWKLDLRVGSTDQIELFSFPSPPKRVSNPEAAGLRHLAFAVENLDTLVDHLKKHTVRCEDVRVDEFTGKRFMFFWDPDDLPLEVYEVKD